MRDTARRLAALDDVAVDGEGESASSASPAGVVKATRGNEQITRPASGNESQEREAGVAARGERDERPVTPDEPQRRSEGVSARGAGADVERASEARASTPGPRKRRVPKRQAQAETEEPVQDSRLKPYVSIAELARLTPWTEQAIRTMMSRGVFQEGKHYFHVGRRPVFKWKEVCHFIHDGLPAPAEIGAPVPHYRDRRKR